MKSSKLCYNVLTSCYKHYLKLNYYMFSSLTTVHFNKVWLLRLYFKIKCRYWRENIIIRKASACTKELSEEKRSSVAFKTCKLIIVCLGVIKDNYTKFRTLSVLTMAVSPYYFCMYEYSVSNKVFSFRNLIICMFSVHYVELKYKLR